MLIPMPYWCRGGSSFNDSFSVFAKVSIRSEPNAARPTWKVEPAALKTRRGHEYERPFELCPYRWYGRLSAFRRPLCQGYWESWYRKQWQSGKVHEQTLEAYNIGAKYATYGLLAVKGRTAEKAIVMGGFEDVTLSQVKAFLTDAASPKPSSGGLSTADLERALTLLQSIDPMESKQWLLQLAQAIKDGTFDAVYDQLLLNSLFQKFRDGIMYLAPSEYATAENAKAFIREVAKFIASSANPDRDAELIANAMAMPDRLSKVYEAYLAYLISQGYNPIWAPVTAYLWTTFTFQPTLWSATSNMAYYSDYPVGQSSEDINAIIDSIYDYYKANNNLAEAGRLFKQLNEVLKNAAGDLWTVSKNACDLVKAFLRAAAEAVTNYGAVIIDILRKIQDSSGRWYTVDLVLKQPVKLVGGGTLDATIYLKFDASRRLDDHTIKSVLSWVNAAVENLESCGCGIIGYHFVNPGVQGISALIQEAYNRFKDKNVAIFFTWYENGQLKFTCIGALCDQMTSQARQNQACMHAGKGPNCGAQEVTLGGGGGLVESQQEEPVRLTPVIPPPPLAPSSSCKRCFPISFP